MNLSVLRLVVLIIGVVVILAVCGVVWLAVQDKGIPGTLETIVLAGVTGLLGLLAPSQAATRN